MLLVASIYCSSSLDPSGPHFRSSWLTPRYTGHFTFAKDLPKFATLGHLDFVNGIVSTVAIVLFSDELVVI